jgi:hypothetical protein
MSSELLVRAVAGTPLARPARGALRIGRTALPALRPRTVVRNTRAYLLDRSARSAYPELDEDELRATRRSDTAFVFGSGKSILSIGADEWREIARFDTVSFSEFPRQRAVRADYHVVGEVADVEEYARILDNPLYAGTVYVLQEGWLASDSNELLGRRLLPAGARVFRYRRTARARFAPPSESFRSGLVHGWNSSISVTNFALLAGWRRIVLAGVDLYDKEYFWLREGERRPRERPQVQASSRFPNAPLIVETFRRWRELLEPRGVELLVYNPRSLLAGALDVFDWGRLGS